LSTNNLSIRNIIGFSLTILLVMQLFAVPIIPVLAKSNYDLYAHYVYEYLIFSYFAITAIILLEIKRLHVLHIDHLTLWLVVISCFIRRRLGIAGEIYYLLPILLVGLVGAMLIIYNRPNIQRTSKKSLFGGIIVACVILILTTLVESFQASKWLNSVYSANILVSLVRELIFQLSFVVLIEEIVFRGFLVGYLIEFGFKEKTAFIVQAFLFWVMHYSRFSNSITFFISIPILTISTSLVVKHYKQVFPSIVIHTFINTLVPLIINIWF
jgi:membrane protease YdiL (CAAX protease family)